MYTKEWTAVAAAANNRDSQIFKGININSATAIVTI